MTATGLPVTGRAWSRVRIGSDAVAAADRDALGTTARVVVWPPERLSSLLPEVDFQIAELDRQASRFRADSEISAVHAAGPGSYQVSDGLAEAIEVALAAARWTAGLADPTIGSALIDLGYDRDFAAIEPSDTAPPQATHRRPAWPLVRLTGTRLTLPPGIRLDLGATAKGLGADRAAWAAQAVLARTGNGDGGVLVSLGGDMAVAGRPPAGGWPVLVADEHRQVRSARSLVPGPRANPRGAGPGRPGPIADPAIAQQVRLTKGGLATSSVTCRQWLRGGQVMHHIVDPRTGLPASGPWRTISVVAASCAEANAAATAAIVAGEAAPHWLARHGLPARLVGHDGQTLRTRGWPDTDGGRIEPPASAWLPAYAGTGPETRREAR
ncbi:MAG TPA: FAD:protein FMN transferase [Streptosporangiaceae bacterium]